MEIGKKFDWQWFGTDIRAWQFQASHQPSAPPLVMKYSAQTRETEQRNNGEYYQHSGVARPTCSDDEKEIEKIGLYWIFSSSQLLKMNILMSNIFEGNIRQTIPWIDRDLQLSLRKLRKINWWLTECWSGDSRRDRRHWGECSVYISTIEIYRDVFIAFDTLFLKAAQWVATHLVRSPGTLHSYHLYYIFLPWWILCTMGDQGGHTGPLLMSFGEKKSFTKFFPA